MKLSRRTDYALRAIVTLAEHYGEPPISSRIIAERNDIPKKFLEQILLEMKSRGWVKSLAGKEGGYLLARNPRELSLGTIVRHFDGILAPIGCVSATQYQPCSQEKACKFRRVFLDVRNYVAHLMDSATLDKVILGTPVKTHEVFTMQGVEGEGI